MRRALAITWAYLLNRRQSRVDTSLKLASIVCGLAAMFYLYEYILQVAPSIMVTDLMRDLQINAIGLGAISASYFYAYAPMQLPAGMLYDRFGPRKVISVAIVVCALGALFFGMTNTIALASAGRFFMGIGSACSFIGALVLVSRWFPPAYFALLAGFVQFMSSMGAVMGEIPVSKWVVNSGWRNVMFSLAVIGIILAMLVWQIVRDYPPDQRDKQQQRRLTNPLRGLAEILRQPQTWSVGIYAFAIWMPIAVFATEWDIPYISAVYTIDRTQAAWICSMIWWGIGIGSPLLGWWSDKIKQRCLPLSVSAAIGIVAAAFVVYVPNIPIKYMYVIMFMFGLAAAGQATCFGVVKDINPSKRVGTAIGLNNMAVLLGGIIFHPLVGQWLQAGWDGTMRDGIAFYNVADFRGALFILPASFLLAFVMSTFFLKETHCKPHYDEE